MCDCIQYCTHSHHSQGTHLQHIYDIDTPHPESHAVEGTLVADYPESDQSAHMHT